jgi:hypothetical protein
MMHALARKSRMRFAPLIGAMSRAHYVSLAVLLGGIGLAACDEPSYIYRPAVSTTSATVNGLPASYYTIPPEAPRGNVRIVTMGFAEIQPQGSAEQLRALHVRMVVANNSDASWYVDTREQHAVLPEGGESRPAYATVDHGAPPVVEIPPRGERTIDLFYPLPAQVQKESALPSFAMLWQVNTNTRAVVDRTPFERQELITDVYPDYYDWRGPYWYDPYYARGGFVGVGFTPVYVSRPVVIHHRVYSAYPAYRVR